jgi:glycogen debranching enzyme
VKSGPVAAPPATISFGRAVLGDLAAATRREWLVTNGLGGFALGTLAGIATRRYDGLLVAATTPPVGRRVLVGGLVERVAIGDSTVALHAHEYADGTIEGRGFELAESFVLDGSVPAWTFAVEDALIERRIWMEHGANTTYVRYRLIRGSRPVRLSVSALVTDREFHDLTRAAALGDPAVETIENGALVRWGDYEGRGTPIRILGRGAEFEPGGGWWWNFLHREETARGQDDVADLFVAGTHEVTLQPRAGWTLVLSAESDPELDGEAALGRALGRDAELIRRAGAERSSRFVRQLVLAADAFIVRRDIVAMDPSVHQASPGASGEAGDDGAPAARYPGDAGPGDDRAKTVGPIESRSVIAGYPWFNDWGRDTMIALPGLTIATGRAEDGAAILRGYGSWVSDGLLPNDFPSTAGRMPEYNTADASLWFIQAVRMHHEATGDDALLRELLPVLREIVDAHISGTLHGIGIDHGDGLLKATAPGLALTWMDARVDDWVVTPRAGKPVEINALWYNALCTVGPWLLDRSDPASGDDAAGQSYMALAEQVAKSFRRKFWRPERGFLADVVDGPDGDETALRPNQVFALSLPFPLLDGASARSTLAAVGRSLLASYGLRTLAPGDPAYRGRYEGDRRARDSAYHQGPAWPWLMGAYAEAVDRVTGDRADALSILRPFEAHLSDAGIGSISELFDGDPPDVPRGCPAQAWSVAEVLRVWRQLARE